MDVIKLAAGYSHQKMEKEFGGMTVNERLYASGQINEFYKAVEEKNIEKVVEILKSVGLNDSIPANLKLLNIAD